tara:strand:+ start:1059 stop:1460 length:402 start_codon:yes stop_codon:yes gene_type:complete
MEEIEGSYTIKDVGKELSDIKKRIEVIENNLNGKMDSLIDLLKDITTTNLRNTNVTTGENVSLPEISDPDLYYVIGEEFIFIKGKKTYQNRDKIKTSFNGLWNKEKSAWAFKKYENFEEKLSEVFPDITEGQM